jgi:hypothetical protein
MGSFISLSPEQSTLVGTKSLKIFKNVQKIPPPKKNSTAMMYFFKWDVQQCIGGLGRFFETARTAW